MGTITQRKRANGTSGYTAQIRLKRGGEIVHTEAQTFERRALAVSWLKQREGELAKPGALEQASAPSKTLGDAIDQYIKRSQKEMGRTKAQVLKTIRGMAIAEMDCTKIRSQEIVEFAQTLLDEVNPDDGNRVRTPQTVGNYISHLASIFTIAKPAWGYPLDKTAMSDAQTVLRSLETIAKSKQRDRRPSLAEMDKIMEFFNERQARGQADAPMHRIVAFALFSTRRQEEIVRVEWRDLDVEHKRILVRDMKHPGQKIGNDIWVDLPDEAIAILGDLPRTDTRIFPYTVDAVSAAFTRACYTLGITTEEMPAAKRLHFHDLRHEGVSRLFEMGKTIPQAASVSGHRSWSSLQRYAHLRQTGDKYANWPWLRIVAPLPSKARN